jgi:hypothetical protein
MKLKRFKVTNFRSVIDSGWISCDDVTTLVGINESGKSNVLLALWKLRPAQGGEIDPLHDLPVTKLSDLRTKQKSTYFIEAVFELGDNATIINGKLGSSFLPTDELKLCRNYSGTYRFSFENEAAQKKLDSLQKAKRIKGAEEEKPGMTYDEIFKALIPYVPTFVYYSNYGNLTSRIYLPHAIKWLNGESVPGVDIKEDQVRTIRVLFDYVNLKPEEILELGQDAADLARKRGGNASPTAEEIEKAEADKEQRSLLLQSAGTKLTKEFRDWWKQGEYKFRFGADGDYFYIWVSDDKRPEEVDLGLRSTGLQWFLSFYLVFLMECKGQNAGSVLLLDEAGLTLHPLAQKDLSAFFNKLSEENQIINTTHSPFIVDSENIDRCRVVYTSNDGGTVVSENLREGSGEIGEKSIYAVHAALGLTVSDVMLQGSKVVIVEGVSDQFYLSAIKNALIRDKKFAPQRELVFAPAGGAKGVQGIASLVSSVSDGLPLVVLDSDKAGDEFKKKLENGLYKEHKERIISVRDVTGIEQSEVEDLIPYEFISRAVEKLLGVQDEDDEFEPESGKPILPQIEAFACDRGITLDLGWKVTVAKTFKKALFGRKQRMIPEDYLKKWTSLFEKLN